MCCVVWVLVTLSPTDTRLPLSLMQVFFQWVSVASVSFAAKMMDIKESTSSLSATFSAGSCAAVANLEPNQRQNISNSNANQLNTSTATPVISLFKLKNFFYQPKFKSLMTPDGKASSSDATLACYTWRFAHSLLSLWLSIRLIDILDI